MSKTDEAYHEFVRICGKQQVLSWCEAISDYGRDSTTGQVLAFEWLVRPGCAEEVSGILKICNEYRIAVTPRGGGSGVSGGALPLTGGVVLSLERLNKIISINEIDGFVIAESGVVVSDLCDAVEARGYYYPAAPSSKGFSFVGGNVATDAGNIHSCLFGKTGDYVLNLEIALPDGELIWTGANVSKSSSGLNLTRLFVGSEGLLGIITKVVCRISARPEQETMILAGFSGLKNAVDALVEMRRSGLPLSMGELFCPNTIKLVSDHLGEPLPLVKEGISHHLLFGCRGTGPVSEAQLVRMAEIVGRFTDEELLVGQAASEKDRLMKLRHNIGNALVSNGRSYRDIDASVPLSALYGYILTVGAIAAKYEIPFVYFGHALDGNLHVMVQSATDREALREIYAFVTDCGGVISGEHGIGARQKEFMELQYSPKSMDIMRRIKHLFDPNGILNPQKVLE